MTLPVATARQVGWLCHVCGYARSVESTLDPSPVCTGTPTLRWLAHEERRMTPLTL